MRATNQVMTARLLICALRPGPVGQLVEERIEQVPRRPGLDRAAAAEQRITQIFVVCSIIAAVALLAGVFLLARAYRQIAASEQMLQATLDSFREGVGAVDYRGRLRAWNSSFLAMLGGAEAKVRPGISLSLVNPGASELGRRIRDVETAAQATNRPVLVEARGVPSASRNMKNISRSLWRS
jgi:PAS domain-containing protein